LIIQNISLAPKLLGFFRTSSISKLTWLFGIVQLAIYVIPPVITSKPLSFNHSISSIWCFRLINLIPLICSKGNLCFIYIAYLPSDLKIKIFSSIKNLPFIFCKILFLLWFWLRLVFIILIYFWILFHDFSPACFIFPNFFYICLSLEKLVNAKQFSIK
jgi:hypothetical protein